MQAFNIVNHNILLYKMHNLENSKQFTCTNNIISSLSDVNYMVYRKALCWALCYFCFMLMTFYMLYTK